jgi:hypothetical protein
MNRYVNAKTLESLVWNKVITFLNNPDTLSAGYQGIIANQEKNNFVFIEKKIQMEKNLQKLEKQLDNLLSAYTDPDIKITKSDYIKQKDLIESKQRQLIENLHTVNNEVKPVMNQNDFDTMLEFSKKIKNQLGENNIDLTLEKKRQLLAALNARVLISIDNNVKVELLRTIQI